MQQKSKSLHILVFLIFLNSGIFTQTEQNQDPETFKAKNMYSRVLKFQSLLKDYMIFYDIESGDKRHLYYLRYRIDRWDYDNDRNAADLIPGQEYVVKFIFEDKVQNERELLGNDKNNFSTESRKIRKVKNIIHGIYSSHFLNQIKNIRF